MTDFLFLGSKITADGDCSHAWNQKTIGSQQESNEKPRQCFEKQRRYSADKGLYSQGYGLPSGHVWLWELDREEGRTPKILYLRNVVLEKTPESSLNSEEIKPANLNGDQPWIFTRRTDAEAEAPVFWSSDVNRWLIGKLGRVESRRRGHQRMRWLDGIIQCKEHELEQTLVDGEEHGSLVCCSPWGHKELDTTGWLNNNVNSVCVCVWKKKKVKSLSCVKLFVTPWTVAYQVPPSMGFSRQEYWSGLPFPSPGDLPDPGTKPGSSTLQPDTLPSEPPGNTPLQYMCVVCVCVWVWMRIIILSFLVILFKYNYHQ